jgi:hypothetical protein
LENTKRRTKARISVEGDIHKRSNQNPQKLQKKKKKKKTTGLPEKKSYGVIIGRTRIYVDQVRYQVVGRGRGRDGGSAVGGVHVRGVAGGAREVMRGSEVLLLELA